MTTALKARGNTGGIFIGGLLLGAAPGRAVCDTHRRSDGALPPRVALRRGFLPGLAGTLDCGGLPFGGFGASLGCGELGGGACQPARWSWPSSKVSTAPAFKPGAATSAPRCPVAIAQPGFLGPYGLLETVYLPRTVLTFLYLSLGRVSPGAQCRLARSHCRLPLVRRTVLRARQGCCAAHAA